MHPQRLSQNVSQRLSEFPGKHSDQTLLPEEECLYTVLVLREFGEPTTSSYRDGHSLSPPTLSPFPSRFTLPECALSPQYTEQAKPALSPQCLLRRASSPQQMGELSAHPHSPTPWAWRAQLPAPGWRRRKAQQQPWKSARGPSIPRSGLIVQGPGDTGEGGTSALDTVRAGLLNRHTGTVC